MRLFTPGESGAHSGVSYTQRPGDKEHKEGQQQDTQQKASLPQHAGNFGRMIYRWLHAKATGGRWCTGGKASRSTRPKTYLKSLSGLSDLVIRIHAVIPEF